MKCQLWHKPGFVITLGWWNSETHKYLLSMYPGSSSLCSLTLCTHCDNDPDHMCLLPGRGSLCWTVPTWRFGLWTVWCRWCLLLPSWMWLCTTAAWAGGCPSPAPHQSSTLTPPLTTLVSGDNLTNLGCFPKGGELVLITCFSSV